MTIKILESALHDIMQGQDFYEQQEVGLGDYFLNSLLADIDSLALYAGIHEIHENQFYRMLAKRFPFAIYYRMSEQTVFVYAVLDCRHDPSWIRKKLHTK